MSTLPSERDLVEYLQHGGTFRHYTDPSPYMQMLQAFEREYRRSVARRSRRSHYTEEDSGDEERRRLLAEQERQRERCRKQGKITKRLWIRKWIKDARAKGLGMLNTVKTTRIEDPGHFRRLVRLPPELFDELLDRVAPRIAKEDTHLRKAHPPELRLAYTLNHLAQGQQYSGMVAPWTVPHNTGSIIVREVCQAICDEYLDDVIKTPLKPEAWLKVAEGFENK